MTFISPGGAVLGGVTIAQQSYIEQRVLTALLQQLEGTSQEGGVNLTQLRLDEAFATGVPASAVIP